MTRADTDGPDRGGCRGERGFGLVEALVALVVLSVGMLGVAGLTGSVAEQTRQASWETEQALVAQQVMDSIRQAGYAAAADGADTLRIAGRQWAAAWTVTEPAPTLKRIAVDVDGRRDLPARTFTARLHRPLALASAKPPQGGGGGGGGGDPGDDGGDDDGGDPTDDDGFEPPTDDSDLVEDLCEWWGEAKRKKWITEMWFRWEDRSDLASQVRTNWGDTQKELDALCP